jgi:hypothetical protein
LLKSQNANASTILKKGKTRTEVRQWRTFSFEAAPLHPTAELKVAEDAILGGVSVKVSEQTTHAPAHPFAPEHFERKM